MSGPKYCYIKMNSPKEAAEVLAQLSVFPSGVKMEIVNNEIVVTISNDAWYQGQTESVIRQKVLDAQNRYLENEEMKILLWRKKDEEKSKIKNKISQLETEYNQEKSKLKSAINQCKDLLVQTQQKIETPFGEYQLSSETESIEEKIRELNKNLSKLDSEFHSATNKCNECLKEIDNFDSIENLRNIQRKYNAIGINEPLVIKDVQQLQETIQNKRKVLKNYCNVLQKLYQKVKSQEFSSYFERIKIEVSKIKFDDTNASKKINYILDQIINEIALKRQEEISKESAEIQENVKKQIEAINKLKDDLRPSLENLDTQKIIQADYTGLAQKAIEECEKILTKINSLEFLNADNEGRLYRLKNTLNNFKNAEKSGGLIDRLNELYINLHKLEEDCKKDNDDYVKFKIELDKYNDLYMQYQGFISGSKNKPSEEVSSIIVNPSEIAFLYGNLDDQINKLKEKNEKLTSVTNQIFQLNICKTFSASLEAESRGKEFKLENKQDNSVHVFCTRNENPNVIYDTECTSDKGICIYPRGVLLPDGRKLTSVEDLQKAHSSCAYAEDLQNFLSKITSISFTFAEMPHEVLDSMYKEENYYRLENEEEAIKFLRQTGRSDEEINQILNNKNNEEEFDDEESTYDEEHSVQKSYASMKK